jgi:hypothetical protein
VTVTEGVTATATVWQKRWIKQRACGRGVCGVEGGRIRTAGRRYGVWCRGVQAVSIAAAAAAAVRMSFVA